MLAIETAVEYRRYTHQPQYSFIGALTEVFSPSCPREGDNLVGPIAVPDTIPLEDVRMFYSEEQIVKSLPHALDEGGSWCPKQCRANYHVAVIIPFRNRHDQLPVLLANLHPILQRQLLDYRIFVVEQAGNSTFNKALIMNIAFITIRKQHHSYDCFVFHDVDLLPEDDRNRYHCGHFPRHLSSAVNEFRYKLPYPQIAGGVLAITTDQFLRVNGYSNLYWGWGGEDDDMFYRIKASGMILVRPPLSIGRYTMIKHQKRTPWNESKSLLVRALSRFHKDGVAQLNSIPYKILHVHPRTLYTHILVTVSGPPPKIRSAGTRAPVEEEKSDQVDIENILDKMRGYS